MATTRRCWFNSNKCILKNWVCDAVNVYNMSRKIDREGKMDNKMNGDAKNVAQMQLNSLAKRQLRIGQNQAGR